MRVLRKLPQHSLRDEHPASGSTELRSAAGSSNWSGTSEGLARHFRSVVPHGPCQGDLPGGAGVLEGVREQAGESGAVKRVWMVAFGQQPQASAGDQGKRFRNPLASSTRGFLGSVGCVRSKAWIWSLAR